MQEGQNPIPSRFRDRADAGRYLGGVLVEYSGRNDVVVLALPRGGVPVGFEVARALEAPLDVFVVRKLGVPGHEELAFGAVASGGARILNRDVIRHIGLSSDVIDAVSERERAELARRERLYRGDRPERRLAGKTVIVVDDGLATGASMRAAVAAVRAQRPARIVVAVPTAALDTCAALSAEVDELVSPLRPANFYAVSLWYDNFEQVSDDEVRRLLEKAKGELGE
ncbi:MAG TPA: phosphoribosyltransferase [Gaiellaceae bacterium]